MANMIQNAKDSIDALLQAACVKHLPMRLVMNTWCRQQGK